jgi:hypothetical protein
MKIISFSTRLTPTAIGQSGTNDSYIYFPKEDYITELFFEHEGNHTINFTDKNDGSSHTLNMIFGRENRLYQFGPYARNKQLNPGDELTLQRVISDDGSSRYFFNFIKYEDIITLEYLGPEKQFVTWNEDRFAAFFPQLPARIEVLTGEGKQLVTVESNGFIKKREDSPTRFASYRLNGLQQFLDMSAFRSKHKLILQKKTDETTYYLTSRPINWEFSVIETGRS